MDVLDVVIEVLFTAILVSTVVAAVRRRDPLMRDVALIFSGIGFVFLLDVIKRVFGATPPVVGIVATILFLLMPIFTIRLVADVRGVPRWLLPSSVVLLVTAIATAVLFGKTLPVVPATLLVGYFSGLEAVAAGYLFAEARGRRGASRTRLAVAGLGTAALALALLVLSGGALVPVVSGATTVGATLTALVAALAYVAAFLPPNQLRGLWQATEAGGYTQDLMLAPAAEPTTEIWSRFVATANGITGGWSFVIIADPDGSSRLIAGVDPVRLAARPGVYPKGALEALQQAIGGADGTVPDGPIRADLMARAGASFLSGVTLAPGVALVMAAGHARLFREDDLALLSVLGAETAMLVERRALLEEQEALSERLAATVAQLESASAAKSDFLASMSHELRTPLNAIIGFSDLMRSTPATDQQVSVPTEWIEHIYRSGQHLLGLINDVLDLAKIEAGRLELVPDAIDLAQMAGESVAGLRPIADLKRVRLETQLGSAVISVDRGRLRQILYNLLSNAIKFTPEGGTVTLSATVDAGVARISVADTGVGIAPADQAHIYEQFRQVGNVELRQGGTGLGLALTRRLVEAHGGHIELESALFGRARLLILAADGGGLHPAGRPSGSSPSR